MPEFRQAQVASLKSNARNARTHSKRQIRQIANSITQFGFVNPIIVDEDNVVIAGHGRLAAAQLLNVTAVPVVAVRGLTDAQKRLLMLADNKIAANAGWDQEKLAIELSALSVELDAEGLEISLSGFEAAEIDMVLDNFSESETVEEVPPLATQHEVARQKDVWILGSHRLMCANARSADDLDNLMDGRLAAMAFLDPPYNVEVRSIGGRGQVHHREFAEASGEQSEAEFIAFLRATLENVARVSKDGSLHYVCMDWRHVGELLAAARSVYDAHINTAIWTKTNAGQGTFYRSQHEEILVFRRGAGHLNNVELGRHGRSRSNVWTYAGANTFRAGRMDDLRAHPTVKPVALVADAIKDCTRRGDVVVDTFCGSGTTILAAERVGRRAFGMEIYPAYVDTAIRRWQGSTKKDALLASTGETFEEVEQRRLLELSTNVGSADKVSNDV